VLHDKMQLAFAEKRLDTAGDADAATDRDALADFEGPLATEAPVAITTSPRLSSYR
jgi:hypothetical protein